MITVKIIFLLVTFLISYIVIYFKAHFRKSLKIIKRFEFSFKYSPKELLYERYIRGEISFEAYDRINKVIECINSDIEQYKIVASVKSNIRAIPENCAETL